MVRVLLLVILGVVCCLGFVWFMWVSLRISVGLTVVFGLFLVASVLIAGTVLLGVVGCVGLGGVLLFGQLWCCFGICLICGLVVVCY